MKILGIDPGSLKSGFSVIEVSNSLQSCRLLHCETVRYNRSIDFNLRVAEIKNSLSRIMKDFNPDQVALESLIYVKSPQALIKLAQTRGIFLSVITDYTDKIYEYSPNLIKMVVTGHGHSDKEAVQIILKKIFTVSQFSHDDESDALAVALCHFLQKGQNSLNTRTKGSGSMSAALSHKINKLAE